MSPKEEAAALTQEAGHVVGISERRSVVKSWTRRSVLEERIEEHPELPSRSHVAPLGVSELVPFRGCRALASPPPPFLLLSPLSNQGPFPLPALPRFPGTAGLSATPNGPACPSQAAGWRVPYHRQGFPCRVHPPPPLPRRNQPVLASLTSQPMPAFPVLQGGSASASPVSRPVRHSLTLRPAWSPGAIRTR